MKNVAVAAAHHLDNPRQPLWSRGATHDHPCLVNKDHGHGHGHDHEHPCHGHDHPCLVNKPRISKIAQTTVRSGRSQLTGTVESLEQNVRLNTYGVLCYTVKKQYKVPTGLATLVRITSFATEYKVVSLDDSVLI